MKYKSAMKRNEVLIHETIWMNSQEIMLSEKNRKNNPTSLYYHSVYVTVLKWQNLEKEKGFVLARGKRQGGTERGGGSDEGQFKGSLLWWELAVSLLSFLFSTKYTCDKIVPKYTQVSTNKTGKSE